MLKLSSDTRNIALVESFVERAVEQYQIAPDIYGNILITLTEAVNNAIIHGNSNDESKTVQIQLRRKNNCLAVRVTDEGEGFDHSAVPDPTAPENLLQVGGRGVFLMQQLSDSVHFHNNGSTVEMRFNL
ncbi:ATP-binding protein [Phaeodactylibacter sp.]|jgi:serine/threonine-protein kinase RsbW|uniref:ATP-binding protein n=1 Tax=Phaeodactylibacter sp. TaxID=1940289 RepID=UPI0025DE6D8D|nr:ATP-binding protein [Phaeodactylibacter sp.]MCI4649844.1 ATP-binding protein [Phaeodactylibacter sp.]MCI5092260.1 ATP-binding protein [Phaeodactylibacter sp.]